MAFEYGESYYGLRTFGSSAGEVKDASAEVSVAATIATTCNRVRLAGALVSVTSSTASVGEEFILEESSAFTYGGGLYGRNQYGTEDLQTVVTATSSVTASATRVRLAGALSASASSITTIGEEVHLGSAAVSATATLTAVAIISVVGAGALTSTATLVAVCNRVRLAGALSSVTSGTATIGQATLKGVAPMTSTATIAAVCNRVRFGSGTPTANASITVLGFATRGGIASTTGTATLVADSEKIHQPSATVLPTATITATGNRVQHVSGIVSVTSGTATIGREKWEIISVTPITWTPETNDSVSWTQIAA